MDIFSQNKLLKKVVVIIVIINLVLIGFVFWKEIKKPKHEPELYPHPEAFKDVSGILKEELNLTAEQTEKIQQLRSDYFEKENSLAKMMKAERDSMNEIMFNRNTDEIKLHQLAHEVAAHEEEMENLRISQAKDLKAICTTEQQEKFEHLVKEIRDYFRPDNQPKRKN
jgi:Spy/CpxP family protein refolding chaperone